MISRPAVDLRSPEIRHAYRLGFCEGIWRRSNHPEPSLEVGTRPNNPRMIERKYCANNVRTESPAN